MPKIYLSPSTQDFNMYYDGVGSEEYYMNLIADAMEPYLTASGIEYDRNTPEMTAATSIKASNAGNYDAHLALHSNAAPPQLTGKITGTDAYYYPGSDRSHHLAEIIAANLKTIYPEPNRVKAVPTTSIGEVSRTRAPAVLVELAYHDNPQDAEWIRSNIESIARILVLALTEYFGIPFIEPQPINTATVDTAGGNVNIRAKPSINSQIVGQAPDGAQLLVLGSWDDWYVIRYGQTEGYVLSLYVTLNYS